MLSHALCLSDVPLTMRDQYRIAVVQAVSNDTQQRRGDNRFDRIDTAWNVLQMFDDLFLVIIKTFYDVARDLAGRRLGLARSFHFLEIGGIERFDKESSKKSAQR